MYAFVGMIMLIDRQEERHHHDDVAIEAQRKESCSGGGNLSAGWCDSGDHDDHHGSADWQPAIAIGFGAGQRRNAAGISVSGLPAVADPTYITP